MTLALTKFVGTPVYMAPEILKKEKYSTPADVFSYAVALFYLFTEQEPYLEFENIWGIAEFILSGQRLQIPPVVPREIRDLISIAWSQNPTERKGFEEIVGYITLIKDTIKYNQLEENNEKGKHKLINSNRNTFSITEYKKLESENKSLKDKIKELQKESKNNKIKSKKKPPQIKP